MRSAAIRGVVLALVLSGAAAVSAQSLGEVARQEAERRKAIAAPGKLYTNEALRVEAPPSTPAAAPAAPAAPSTAGPAAPGASTPGTPPAAQAATPGAPAAEPAPLTEADWGKRMADARAALSRSQIFAEALQSRINALTTDFVNRDDPAQRDAIAGERQKALTELDRVKQEIADQQKAITAVQDDARRAGVPAGWVR